VIGGAIGAGITFVSFKPCCDRLKNTLRDTMLSNPDHVSSEEENKYYNCIINGEIIYVEYEEVEVPDDELQTD